MFIKLQPNAKDIDGYTLPLCFFDGCVQLIEEHERTYLLKCDNQEVIVLKDYIRKP